MSLSRVRIVLVNPRHPGNIGAVARSMKTMGLDQLVLVGPDQFPAETADRRAVGAVDILRKAVVTESLETTTSDCKLVVGVSARVREMPLPTLDAREGGARIVQEAAAGDPVAILFGSERDGLSNESLDACTYQLRIPATDEFNSLNLAAAVQLVVYEIFMAAGSEPSEQGDASPYPSREEMEFFFRQFERTLVERNFYKSINPERVNQKLRRLIARARPEANELRLLHSLVRLMSRD